MRCKVGGKDNDKNKDLPTSFMQTVIYNFLLDKVVV